MKYLYGVSIMYGLIVGAAVFVDYGWMAAGPHAAIVGLSLLGMSREGR